MNVIKALTCLILAIVCYFIFDFFRKHDEVWIAVSSLCLGLMLLVWTMVFLL